MALLRNIYEWLMPTPVPGPCCDCGRAGTQHAWGEWRCDACEAKRASDVWP